MISKILYRAAPSSKSELEILFLDEKDKGTALVFSRDDFFKINISPETSFSDFKDYQLKSSAPLDILSIKRHSLMEHFVTFSNGLIMAIYFYFDKNENCDLQAFKIETDIRKDQVFSNYGVAEDVKVVDFTFSN